MMGLLTITDQNFDEMVIKSDLPVLVDFWAQWCAPCRSMTPILEKYAEENPGVRVGKVNVDDEGALAERYEVRSIPMFLVFKGGKVVGKAVGARGREELADFVKSV